MKHQSLRDIYRVTEWKKDCVYRTKHAYYAWVTTGVTIHMPENYMIGSISTKMMVELNHKTQRTVSDDTPDVVRFPENT